MDILNHRLVECEAVHMNCTKNKKPLVDPDTLVFHYTAGSSARSAAEYLSAPEVKASAHLVIGRRGEIFQLLPFNVEAWHAGRSFHLGRSGLNRYSIGIELENLGRLQRTDAGFVAECGKSVPDREVFVDDSGETPTYWHRYTPLQLHVTARVCLLLLERYPISHLLRHSDITPRKQDPGPAFPAELLALNCPF